MNLGDGLLFELENGKPKLLFRSHGLESKAATKISKNSSTNRQPKPAFKPFSPDYALEGPQRAHVKPPGTYRSTSNTPTQKHQTVINGTGKTKAKTVYTVESTKTSNPQKISGVNEMIKPLKQSEKESLVCLTQEQLQHILSSIHNKPASSPAEQHDTHSKAQMVPEDCREDGRAMFGATQDLSQEAVTPNDNMSPNGIGQEKGKDNGHVINGGLAGFLDGLGERELEKQRLEARKAQWRRELDEQLIKKQQERSDAALLEQPWPMSARSISRDIQIKGDEYGCGSLSQRSTSRATSIGTEASCALGGDGQGRLSMDTTTGGKPPQSSYLRTMTALLDPAQLEERERKRLKQLEHRRAISSQVEEKRRLREKEELERKRWEQEEESRVAKEREHLQQQYLLDAKKEKNKEEQLNRRAQEMLLSVQRAQEEAQKCKQLQRIRDLASKGHDVSKLLGSLERKSTDSVQAVSAQSQNPLHSLSITVRAEDLSHLSPRQETGVQTDMDGRLLDAKPDGERHIPAVDMLMMNHSPTPPAQHHRSSHWRAQLQKTTSSGQMNTQNSITTAVEPQGEPRGGVSLYDPFQNTNANHRLRPANGKKPEWNVRQPSRPFVPASERYPQGLRLHRQENRLRRQMELMALVEKKSWARTTPLPQEPAVHSSLALPKDDISDQSSSQTTAFHSNRLISAPLATFELPPQGHQSEHFFKERSEKPSDGQTAADYIPYVRTDEVYHLDPLAVPHKPEPQHKWQSTGAGGTGQSSPVAVRDPLLHPDVLKNCERQKAILKGLSELRQGLMQKQKELEMGLNPLL
ncbi:coiled-coil domain-containing protein 66 [Engraulis encrasicolus]|uniref:coiled-coil domain-containing protein 66 n=1 Tax=Engraulis encrasicolus TaxID=184585 RepID=UPI002FD29B00